jgi:CheY-like chemotaxis protein
MTRILVVEDEQANLATIRDLLNFEGYEVLEARNGRDGVEVATANKPDIILLDMRMPEMDGYEVARQLKAGPETKEIPIIALTGNAMDEQRREAMDAGCDDFIAKPVDFDNLLDRIAVALKVNDGVG